MKATLLAVLILVMCILGGIAINAQTPMPYVSKNTAKAKPLVENWQGYKLPASCSKSDTVFITKTGKLFVFKTSKNTGKRYRYYLEEKK